MNDLVLAPVDFVALLNQTLEYAYPSVTIVGELANFRVSKNKWVYFDLKDEYASVKFFGMVYQLPGPLEDGLLLQVSGTPRLHPLYGFSVTIKSIQPVGEGSIRRAAELLEAKLAAEGLFDPARKRPIPFPPARIGLITSGGSAAYHDFTKILGERWGGLSIDLADVQVQGEAALGQIAAAIDYFGTHASPPDVLVITRGGGSAEDLAAFSSEQVTRAVAGSRIPTLVAIGHEVDISLAELAADQRASTPSNAAELLVPDKREVFARLRDWRIRLTNAAEDMLSRAKQRQQEAVLEISVQTDRVFERISQQLILSKRLLSAYDPAEALKRGFAIVRQNGVTVRSARQIKANDQLAIELHDGTISAEVKSSKVK